MHSRINECLIAARECLPSCNIQILTNGALLPNMPDEFFNCCIENNISISVSEYPIGIDYEEIIKDVKEKGVDIEPCNYAPEKMSFVYKPYDPNGGYDPKLTYAKCSAYPHVRNGRMYPCPDMALIDALNEAFGTDFQCKAGKDYIEIDKIKDKLDVLKFLVDAKPFCKYCGLTEITNIPWHRSTKNADEWIKTSICKVRNELYE